MLASSRSVTTTSASAIDTAAPFSVNDVAKLTPDAPVSFSSRSRNGTELSAVTSSGSPSPSVSALVESVGSSERSVTPREAPRSAASLGSSGASGSSAMTSS